MLQIVDLQVGKKIDSANTAIRVSIKGVGEFDGVHYRTSSESEFKFPELEADRILLAGLIAFALDELCEFINKAKIGVGNEMETLKSLPF